MKKLISFILIILFVVVSSILILPRESKAVASFARELGQSCTLCHWAVPKLNHFGIMYKYNGYRMTPGQSVDVWEFKTVPLTFLIEVEGEVNRGV